METFRVRTSVNPKTRFLESVWIRPGAAPRTVPTALHENELPEARAALGRSLQRVRDLLGMELVPSWEEIDTALGELRKAGTFLANTLFAKNLPQVVQLWRDFVLASSDSNEPFALTLESACETKSTGGREQNLILPFEFLPLFRKLSTRPPSYSPVRTYAQLEASLSEFVGFRCIVSRVVGAFGEFIPRKSFRPGNGDPTVDLRLTAKMFVCRTLNNVAKEERCLKKHLSARSWPRRGNVGTVEKLAELLWLNRFNSQREDGPEIHHFASHFDTESDLWEEHEITLAGCENSEFTASLFNLSASFAAWQFTTSANQRDRRPFVFVNACGSSKLSPKGCGSLPDLFLGTLGSVGFIGTETTIADAFAMRFAVAFYAQLSNGSTVGRALYDSRRMLLRKHSNFLGMFYTNYSSPQLKLRSNHN